MLGINRHGVYERKGIQEFNAHIKSLGLVTISLLKTNKGWAGAESAHMLDWGFSSPITVRNKFFTDKCSAFSYCVSQLKENKSFKADHIRRLLKIIEEKYAIHGKSGQLDMFGKT